MIKILQVRNVDSFVESRRQKILPKDRKIVQSILDDVRKNGDSAVKKYEKKFNGKKTSQLRLSKQEIKQAEISIEEFNALKLSAVKLSMQQRNLKKSIVESVKKIPNVSFEFFSKYSKAKLLYKPPSIYKLSLNFIGL